MKAFTCNGRFAKTLSGLRLEIQYEGTGCYQREGVTLRTENIQKLIKE